MTSGAATGTINVQHSDLIITDTTQYTTVKAAIASGYNGGAWNGPGINSSSAAAQNANGSAYGIGYAQASSIGVSHPSMASPSPTTPCWSSTPLIGDTNLKGSVGLQDYTTVVGNFNTPQEGPAATSTTPAAPTSGCRTTPPWSVTSTPTPAAISRRRRSRRPSRRLCRRRPLPAAASTDLLLVVNKFTGDVQMVATTITPLADYNIFDNSGDLLDSGDGNNGGLGRLQRVHPFQHPGGGNYNTTTYRNATKLQPLDQHPGQQPGPGDGIYTKYKSGTPAPMTQLSSLPVARSTWVMCSTRRSTSRIFRSAIPRPTTSPRSTPNRCVRDRRREHYRRSHLQRRLGRQGDGEQRVAGCVGIHGPVRQRQPASGVSNPTIVLTIVDNEPGKYPPDSSTRSATAAGRPRCQSVGQIAGGSSVTEYVAVAVTASDAAGTHNLAGTD